MMSYANCPWHIAACCILVGCVLAGITECAEARQDGAVVYVACGGDDTWSGSLPSPNREKTDGPVATVHRAIELARRNRGDSQEGYAVQIRQGTYYLSESLVFGEEDSGTTPVPTVIGAYQDEHPILVGARRLEGWNSHQDSILRTSLAENKIEGRRGEATLRRWPSLDPGTISEPRSGPSPDRWLGLRRQPGSFSRVFSKPWGRKRAFSVREEDQP